MFNTFYKTFMVRFTSNAALSRGAERTFFAFFLFADTALIYINTFDDDDGVFLSRFPVIFNIIIHYINSFLSLSLFKNAVEHVRVRGRDHRRRFSRGENGQ